MDFILLIVGLIIIYLIGTIYIEKKHFRSLQKREAELLSLPLITIEKDYHDEATAEVWIVTGTTVISVDFFKRFVANIINLFGGEIGTYASVMDRARREALIRMKEKAHKVGADALLNARIETSPVNQSSRGKIGAIELLASATAVKWRN